MSTTPTSIPVIPAVSATPVIPSSPLDGSAQFTVLALLVAVVAYLRNVPVKQLSDARKLWYESQPTTADEAEKRKEKLRSIYIQTIILDTFQIILVSLAVAVAGRSVVWGSALDSLILWSLFFFAILFLAFHVWIDVDGIQKSAKALRRL